MEDIKIQRKLFAGLLFAISALLLATGFAWAAAAPAWDDSSEAAYPTGADTWTTGDNGGSGLGAWTLSSTNSSNAGHFIGSSTNNGGGGGIGIDFPGVGGDAWGMWSNNNATADAKRSFNSGLSSSDYLRLRMDNGWVQTGGSVGFELLNAAGENLMVFQFNGGDSTYKIVDGGGSTNTFCDYTDEGLWIEYIKINGDGTYDIKIVRQEDSTEYEFFDLDLISRANQVPTQVRFYSYNAGSGSNYNVYFNRIAIAATATAVKLQSIQARTTGNGLLVSFALALAAVGVFLLRQK